MQNLGRLKRFSYMQICKLSHHGPATLEPQECITTNNLHTTTDSL